MRPARKQLQVFASLGLICGLTQRPTVDYDIGVTCDHQPVPLHGRGLHPSVLEHLDLWIAAGQLLDARDHHLELDSQLPKDLAPLGRPRCEYDSQESSGNQISISRSADSSESEPWTMLKVTSRAKSPRIEPGAASTGLVAPIS